MALATLPLVSFVDPEFGQIDVTLQYDNVAMRATGVICNNPSPNSCSITITRDSDGKTIARVFGPGDSTLSIPTGAANRIDLTFNSRGNLDGYSFGGTYPV